MPLRALAFAIVLAAVAILPGRAGASPDPVASFESDVRSPYVFQRHGDGPPASASLMYEAAYGTRESRNFAPDGVEQGLRLRYQPWEFLGFEAFGGIVLDPGHGGRVTGEAVSVEAIGRVLRQDRHAVNLHLGAGVIRDYRGDTIPRVRLALGRSFGRLDVGAAGLLEIPIGAAGRDEADVMVSLAASYGITRWFRAGVELAGEDLEGFGDAEESEGGAKLLIGPTVAFDLPANLMLRLNLATVYAHLSNQVAAGRSMPDTWGFMGRLVLGWTFL